MIFENSTVEGQRTVRYPKVTRWGTALSSLADVDLPPESPCPSPFYLCEEVTRILVTLLDHCVHLIWQKMIADSLYQDIDLAGAAAEANAEPEIADDTASAIEVLERALTDVTNADLSHTDLSSVPLEGVLWSSHTQWPPHLAGDIRARSEQIGPDLWRITDNDTNNDTYVTQTA